MTTTATDTMTAADHFRAGEELLDRAAKYLNDKKVPGWAALAQAHFAAARLLLDANTPGDATRTTGLWDLAYERRTA